MTSFSNSLREHWRSSKSGRQLLFSARRLVDELALPFKALRRGHIFLVLYTLGLSALAFWGTLELTRKLFQLLSETRIQNRLTPETIVYIWCIASSILWVLSIPIFLTAVALPLRFVWMRGNISGLELIGKTGQSIQFSLRTLIIAMRMEIYNLIPVLAMIVIYFAFVKQQNQAALLQIYTVALIAVVCSAMWKSLPLFLAPILSVVGLFDGYDATRYSTPVFRPKNLEFIAIMLGISGVLLAIYLQFHGHRIVISGYSSAELCMYAAISWYGVSLIAFKTMQALATATEKQTSATTQINSAAQSSPNTEQQRPVINIQNLWVSQDEKGFKVRNQN